MVLTECFFKTQNETARSRIVSNVTEHGLNSIRIALRNGCHGVMRILNMKRVSVRVSKQNRK